MDLHEVDCLQLRTFVLWYLFSVLFVIAVAVAAAAAALSSSAHAGGEDNARACPLCRIEMIVGKSTMARILWISGFSVEMMNDEDELFSGRREVYLLCYACPVYKYPVLAFRSWDRFAYF